ncbi:unnamed protein product [Cylicocyclus nassatus]|uniref:Uncharacterized protein n=1 Tax=Cylicocyclus nassatus TaxID=53992 RepID=A0AA36DPW3_CYLNA|nr:unnamed protein product [Cylicocyclus nassatus]
MTPRKDVAKYKNQRISDHRLLRQYSLRNVPRCDFGKSKCDTATDVRVVTNSGDCNTHSCRCAFYLVNRHDRYLLLLQLQEVYFEKMKAVIAKDKTRLIYLFQMLRDW